MAAKPIVDGVEKRFANKVQVIRLDLLSPVGKVTAKQYGVWMIPSVILFDEKGQEITRQLGVLHLGKLKNLN